VFPLNLYARVRFLFVHLAHETAGAARTRHSLRPLILRGLSTFKTSGAWRSEKDNVCKHLVASFETHRLAMLLRMRS